MDDPTTDEGDLSRFCCQTPSCAEHGRRGAGHLTVTARIGRDGQYRLLRCRACKSRFSDRRGTVFFGSHLPAAKVTSILAHVREGCGMRRTGRLVGTKEATNRGLASPADDERGDRWDHVALDPEHRLVLSVVPGKRTAANAAAAVVSDAARRMGGRTPRLVTTDGHAPHEQAILDAFGVAVTPPRTGKPGRPRRTRREPHPELTYATVRKARARGRMASVVTTLFFGTAAMLAAARRLSSCSRRVNASFIERAHGTDRHRNARKSRRTYRFSKDVPTHDAVGHFAAYRYDFCWPVRTLSDRGAGSPRQPPTPAMAAGPTDHVWPLADRLALPAVKRAA